MVPSIDILIRMESSTAVGLLQVKHGLHLV